MSESNIQPPSIEGMAAAVKAADDITAALIKPPPLPPLPKYPLPLFRGKIAFSGIGKYIAALGKGEKISAEEKRAYIAECCAAARATEEQKKLAFEYLKTRGIQRQTMDAFGVGYTDDGGKPSILIPYNGETSGYFIRRYTATKPNSSGARYDYPSKEIASADIFNFNSIYTLKNTTEGQTVFFITEGQIDAMTLWQCGGLAIAGSKAPASLVTALNGAEAEIPALRKRAIFAVVPDIDKDTQSGAKMAAACVQELAGAGYRAAIYPLPDNTDKMDSNSFLLKHGADELKRWIAAAMAAILQSLAGRYNSLNGAMLEKSFWAAVDSGHFCEPYNTGFPLLNKYLGGGLDDGLCVFGAESSMGKTTFVLQMADQMAAQGYRVLIFSLEMATDDLIGKSISRLTARNGSYQTAVNEGQDIRCQTMTSIMKRRYKGNAEAEASVAKARAEYASIAQNITIFEPEITQVTAYTISARVRDFVDIAQLTGGEAQRTIVIVDYLQLMTSAIKGDEREKIDDNIRAMKMLAKELRIPVILISSFNRTNYGKGADMASFKESGLLEYSGDTILALQPEGISLLKECDTTAAKESNPRKLELVILKNRRGRVYKTCGILYSYYPAYNYFEEEATDTLAARLDAIADAKAEQLEAKAAKKAQGEKTTFWRRK